MVPIEKEIQATHEALPYEKVSSIIETGQSFMIQDCICKKEQALLDNPCDRPLEVCLAIAPVEGVFNNTSYGRKLTRAVATRDRVARMLEKYCQAEVMTTLLSPEQRVFAFES